jgi:hypothetical protein
MKKKEDQIAEQGISQFQGGFNGIQGEALNKALTDYGQKIRKSITNKSGFISKQEMAVQQGFVAEAHHVGSFNVEAAARGLNNHRATRDVGQVNHPVTDIRLTTPTESTDYQVKFYKDGEKTSAALSPEKYDGIGKVVPSEQLESVKSSARRQALRNQPTRPSVSRSNQDTAQNATDVLKSRDGKVSSTGLNRRGRGSSEELVRESQKTDGGPDYRDKARVRGSFNMMQYRTAAKHGAIAGAVIESVAVLREFLQDQSDVSPETCLEAAQKIVGSAAKGAGYALATTGIQHVGQSLIDSAASGTRNAVSGSMGKQLVKGNVAAAVTQITVQLAKNLYDFSSGKIDSLEFASSSIGGTMQTVGSSLAYGLGAGASSYMGTFVSASVSNYAIAGTTLGTLGSVASGAAFAIGFALAAGAYTNHFSAQGQKIANNDIQSTLETLNGAQIDISQYVGKIGKMSELRFEWKDLLPFSGGISAVAEYQVRKKHLKQVQASVEKDIKALPEQERAIMLELSKRYGDEILEIERQFDISKRNIREQSLQHFDYFQRELNSHLQQRYLVFAPEFRKYSEKDALIDLEARREEENARRAKLYQQELDSLKIQLDQSQIPHSKLKEKLTDAILSRLELIIPRKTGWDEACEFIGLDLKML